MVVNIQDSVIEGIVKMENDAVGGYAVGDDFDRCIMRYLLTCSLVLDFINQHHLKPTDLLYKKLVDRLTTRNNIST